MSNDERHDPAEAMRLTKIALANPIPVTDERCLWLPPSARAEGMRASFNSAQRGDLKRMGVDAEQLKRLELALRIIKVYTAPPADLTTVRKPLADLAKAANKTAKLLESLLRAPEHDSAMTESKGRLLDAIYQANLQDFDESSCARKLAVVNELRDCAELALHEIPRTQSRYTNHPYPIGYINAALEQGFVATQKARGESRWLPYPFKPSASPGSDFRKIVAVCYAAAGAPNDDPERAIKAYVKESASKVARAARQARILAAEEEIRDSRSKK